MGKVLCRNISIVMATTWPVTYKSAPILKSPHCLEDGTIVLIRKPTNKCEYHPEESSRFPLRLHVPLGNPRFPEASADVNSSRKP